MDTLARTGSVSSLSRVAVIRSALPSTPNPSIAMRGTGGRS